MKRVRVTFEADIPEDVTDQEIRNWINFELGAYGSLSVSNPLSNHELEADHNGVIISLI